MSLYVIRTKLTGEYVIAPRQDKDGSKHYTNELEHAWILYRSSDAKAFITRYNKNRDNYIKNGRELPKLLAEELEIVTVTIIEIGVTNK